MTYLLGADVGGTKTHVLIADETGHALGFGDSGGGNHESVGYAGLQTALQTAMHQALAQAGLTLKHISGAGLGIAGYDWPSQREAHLKALAEIGLTMPLEIVNDAVVGLLAGATEGWGVGVVAGTSCNCWGRDPQGRYGRVVGMGNLVSENGGATELVQQAFRAVALEWTQRGPATQLTPMLVQLIGAHDATDLLEGVTTGRLSLDETAAPLVFRVAEQGDAVARECLAWAGRELASLALGVVRQLGLEQSDFEVVLIGSLFNGGPLLIDPLREALGAIAPQARLVRLATLPVIGGVWLGLEQVKLNRPAARQRLIETTQTILKSPSKPDVASRPIQTLKSPGSTM